MERQLTRSNWHHLLGGCRTGPPQLGKPPFSHKTCFEPVAFRDPPSDRIGLVVAFPVSRLSAFRQEVIKRHENKEFGDCSSSLRTHSVCDRQCAFPGCPGGNDPAGNRSPAGIEGPFEFPAQRSG